MVKKYTKKPVAVEAIRFTGTEESAKEILLWVKEKPGINTNPVSYESLQETISWTGRQQVVSFTLEIDTLAGIMTAEPGDYIIRGIKGEYYPCKPNIFEETYEEQI